MFIAKLNESHHRSEISPGLRYNLSLHQLIDHLRRPKGGLVFASTEMTALQSPLRNLLVSETAYRERIDDICVGRAGRGAC